MEKNNYVPLQIRKLEIKFKKGKKEQKQLQSITEVVKFMMNLYKDDIDYRETFSIITLDHSNRPTGYARLFKGGIDCTTIDVKVMMHHVLLSNSCGLIIFHNHPSGKLVPSDSDIRLTNKINNACKLLDIRLLDHIILTSGGHYSFLENGLMN